MYIEHPYFVGDKYFAKVELKIKKKMKRGKSLE